MRIFLHREKWRAGEKMWTPEKEGRWNERKQRRSKWTTWKGDGRFQWVYFLHFEIGWLNEMMDVERGRKKDIWMTSCKEKMKERGRDRTPQSVLTIVSYNHLKLTVIHRQHHNCHKVILKHLFKRYHWTFFIKNQPQRVVSLIQSTGAVHGAEHACTVEPDSKKKQYHVRTLMKQWQHSLLPVFKETNTSAHLWRII